MEKPRTPDEVALDELMADNTRRIEAVAKRGVSPLEISAVIRQINEDTVYAHVLYHLGRILDRLDPEAATLELDLLILARLTAAGKLSRWLDEAERAVERGRLSVVGNAPRG
jgi:hypothetical protein